MTRDEVIALAREAAFHTPVMEGELMRFAALAYERGFVDGMSEQAKRSVDKAVNRMAEQNPFGDDAERYARKLREEREVRNLADYEFKTYKTGGAELEAGFYSTDELRDLVKALDKMNAATERSMRRMK